MKFNSIVTLTLASLLLSAPAFADAPTGKCGKQVEAAAAKADKKRFNAEANSCGSKLLHQGAELETYIVCVTDETDASEWIVTAQPEVLNKKGEVVGTCKVAYTGYAVEASTPDFDN